MNKQILSLHDRKPVRKHEGEKWKTNSSNKKYLAVDFHDRCGYCGDVHSYTGGYNTYHVEHFAPKEKFSSHQFLYENLIYACPMCNLSKSDKWVGKTANENIINFIGFIDPCHDEYDEHLYRKEDGSIFYRSSIGEYMYRELKLYLDRHRIIYLLSKCRESFFKLEKLIREKKDKGENYEKLEQLQNSISRDFIMYFDNLRQNL